LGHFTASFPTPATFGAQAIQAPFQANGSGARFPWSGHPGANALVPPAVARQTFQSAREPPPPLLDHAPGWCLLQLPAEAKMEIRSDLKSSGS